MKEYNGSCHCGDIRFEVKAAIDHVRVCDCTVCKKRGAFNFRMAIDPDSLPVKRVVGSSVKLGT